MTGRIPSRLSLSLVRCPVLSLSVTNEHEVAKTWMRMPGQTWLGAAASFVGMWVVMMAAMMLPSLTPMLWRYRESIGGPGGARLGWLTALVGVGYFAVWTVLGAIV